MPSPSRVHALRAVRSQITEYGRAVRELRPARETSVLAFTGGLRYPLRHRQPIWIGSRTVIDGRERITFGDGGALRVGLGPFGLTSADDTAQGLNQLLKEGKIQSAGVSNYSVHQFDLLNSRMDQPLVTNQLEFHLQYMDPIYDGTFDQCQRLKVQPMAWSPLGGGRLFDLKLDAAQRLKNEAALLAPRYNNATLEQLAYAWIMAHPSGPLPVIGTNKIERMQSAAQAVEIKLEREDWFALWEAAQGRKIP